jgi:hypothetical protein
MSHQMRDGPLPGDVPTYPRRTGARIASVVFVLILAASGGGCALVAPARQPTEGSHFERHCAPPSKTAVFTVEKDRTDVPSIVMPDMFRELSSETLSIARVLRVMPHLQQLYRLEREGRRHTLEFVETRAALTDRLFLALFEINGLVAEITCERDRADQVADRMDEIDTSRVRTLTLASILVGGVASIISGAVGLAAGASVAADASDVGGGVLTSLFGTAALLTESRHSFRHERNVLKGLWQDDPDSTLFSPTVWRYLHTPKPDQRLTPRQEIIQAWQQEGRLGEPGSKEEVRRKTLFFGDGGMYSAVDLRARASMLETLEASIHLINEHLELFIRETMLKTELS